MPGNDDDDHAPMEKTVKLDKIKCMRDRVPRKRRALEKKHEHYTAKRQKEEGQDEPANYQDTDMTERPRSASLTASTVRIVFLCGVAYLVMTVWRADAKMSLLQEKDIGGEHIDIPGWKLATALNIPTGMALRLKKSFCELVNALLEWYLTERDPKLDLGVNSHSTKAKKEQMRWKRNMTATKAQRTTVLGAVQYQGEEMRDEEAAECVWQRSKIPHSTVQDVVAVNKMAGRRKAQMENVFPISLTKGRQRGSDSGKTQPLEVGQAI